MTDERMRMRNLHWFLFTPALFTFFFCIIHYVALGSLICLVTIMELLIHHNLILYILISIGLWLQLFVHCEPRFY